MFIPQSTYQTKESKRIVRLLGTSSTEASRAEPLARRIAFMENLAALYDRKIS